MTVKACEVGPWPCSALRGLLEEGILHHVSKTNTHNQAADHSLLSCRIMSETMQRADSGVCQDKTSSKLVLPDAGDPSGSDGGKGGNAADLLAQALGKHRQGAKARKTGLRERA